MGTTLASCSHFVTFELLQPWCQATVMVVGWFLIFFLLAHSVDLLFNPSLSGFAFYSITFRLSLRFSLRSTFPDGAFYRIQPGSFLAISSSVVWNIAGFSAFLFSGIVEETCVSFFSPSLTQPSNERLAFYRIDWTIWFLFSSNLWLLRGADPRVWMIRFFTQLRVFPRFHYFKVTFYRWPDISKIHRMIPPCK